MSSIWDGQRRDWESSKTPASERRLLPVVSVLLYTGETAWQTPLLVSTQMDLPEPLERFVPGFDILPLNVKAATDQELLGSGHPFGWLVRAVREENAAMGI